MSAGVRMADLHGGKADGMTCPALDFATHPGPVWIGIVDGRAEALLDCRTAAGQRLVETADRWGLYHRTAPGEWEAGTR